MGLKSLFIGKRILKIYGFKTDFTFLISPINVLCKHLSTVSDNRSNSKTKYIYPTEFKIIKVLKK